MSKQQALPSNPSLTPSQPATTSTLSNTSQVVITPNLSTNQSINQKVYLLERELEVIKVKQLCLGRVPVKEIDEFLEKVQVVKNEYLASKL